MRKFLVVYILYLLILHENRTDMLDEIISKIDAINAQDPNKESWDQKEYPKELIYSKYMKKSLVGKDINDYF